MEFNRFALFHIKMLEDFFDVAPLVHGNGKGLSIPPKFQS